MTPAEERFKAAVCRLVAAGVYPAPKAIRQALGLETWRRLSGGYVLDGRQTRWRREVLRLAGWTEYKGPHFSKPRFTWTPPGAGRS